MAEVLLIPFAGTSFGAAMVFFMRRKKSPGLEKGLLGFAAGVMIAASVWSLLLPSIEMAQKQKIIAWIPAVSGFLLGILFLMGLNMLIPLLYQKSAAAEGKKKKLSRTSMLVLAVTLHNFPEGMAVGIAYVGACTENSSISMAGVIALAVGIAIQNFPEGAIISMPLRTGGMSRGKAYFAGVLSGTVEPAGAILTIVLAKIMYPLLPYLLALAAGAMLYVVVEELIPESQADGCSSFGTLGAAIGFVIMMALDVAFG